MLIVLMKPVMQALLQRTLIIALMLGLTAKIGFADTGVITYAVGNCFVIKTENGLTLIERSGGASPEVGKQVKGNLYDYGYQQIYDQAGNELFIGYVQYWGVSKGTALASFKQECR